MAKDRESITIDSDINKDIHDEAKRQRLSFSTLINRILNEYLIHLKEKKSE
jgi:hypothetical protein